MRITYLKLKNYTAIKAGLSMKEIEIDFLKSKNILNILKGCNGSGKTTIMNTLHPFSDGSSILEGKKGYKEIHFTFKNKYFRIKHFYEPTGESHRTKSFIMKNGEELNENGNVTSFNETVEKELFVNQDILKLLRLGPEMNNLINMTSTERKKYMSKFLKGIEEYLSIHKRITDKMKFMKKDIQNVINKINKLSSREIYETKISLFTKRINEESMGKNEMEIKLFNLKEEFRHIDLNISPDIRERIASLKDSYSKYKSISIFNTFKGTDEERVYILDKIKETINNLKIIKVSKESSINELTSVLKFSNEQIKNIESDITELENNIEKIEINDITKQEENLKFNKDYLKTNVNKYETLKESYGFINETVYNNTLDSINKINNIMELILSDNKTTVIELLSLEKKNYYEEYEKLTKEEAKISNQIDNLRLTIDEKSKYPTINIAHLKDECKQCEYIKCLQSICLSQDEITNMNDSIISLENYLKEIQEKKTNINSLKLIEDDIFKIMTIIGNINPGMKNILELNRAMIIRLLKISSSNVTNEYELSDLKYKMNFIQEYETIKSNIDRQEEELIKDKESEKLLQSYDMQKKKKEIVYKEKIKEYREKEKELNDTKSVLSDIEGRLSKGEEDLISYDLFMNYKMAHDKLSNELSLHASDLNRYEQLSNSISHIENEVNKSIEYLKENNEELIKLRIDLKELDTLKETLDKLSKDYKDTEILKKAVSSNEGIPLKYIESFLSRTKERANELLSEAFEGKLQLSNFIINEKEFRIPFIKNEYTPDVSKGSSGERSLISLALSLALSFQIDSRYNILLLDEVDGPLDDIHKKLFLKILETQIEKFDIEQVFIISHNQLFDDSNLSYILLRNHNVDNKSNKNIIYEY